MCNDVQRRISMAIVTCTQPSTVRLGVRVQPTGWQSLPDLRVESRDRHTAGRRTALVATRRWGYTGRGTMFQHSGKQCSLSPTVAPTVATGRRGESIRPLPPIRRPASRRPAVVRGSPPPVSQCVGITENSESDDKLLTLQRSELIQSIGTRTRSDDTSPDDTIKSTLDDTGRTQ